MLQEIVTGCASLGGPPELDAFRKHLPQEWIEETLRATGTATVRRRPLPAEQPELKELRAAATGECN
jgi:hypothetical protein